MVATRPPITAGPMLRAFRAFHWTAGKAGGSAGPAPAAGKTVSRSAARVRVMGMDSDIDCCRSAGGSRMTRGRWPALVAVAVAAVRLASAADEAPVRRIAFGSCLGQDGVQPIWKHVLAAKPDVFVFLGDNVYADTTDPVELRAAYAKLDAQPGYRQLKRTTRVLATWDDHDYGRN